MAFRRGSRLDVASAVGQDCGLEIVKSVQNLSLFASPSGYHDKGCLTNRIYYPHSVPIQ